MTCIWKLESFPQLQVAKIPLLWAHLIPHWYLLSPTPFGFWTNHVPGLTKQMNVLCRGPAFIHVGTILADSDQLV